MLLLQLSDTRLSDEPQWTSTSAISLPASPSHEAHRSSDSELVVANAIYQTMTMALNYSSNGQTSQELMSLSRDLQPAARSAADSEEGNAHPAKRQRVLACKRCRHRKQKVCVRVILIDHIACRCWPLNESDILPKCDGDGEAPCSNCRRASEGAFIANPRTYNIASRQR